MTTAKCLLLFVVIALTSCWKWEHPRPSPDPVPGVYPKKVWGYKPVYGTEAESKKILYSPNPENVISAGNIYAYHNYIFQMDAGRGIHVIDNTTPSSATRIGFITVKGCAQISIKDQKLFTNSYDDLVVIDISDLNNMHEISRLNSVFTEYRYYSPLAQPPAPGYYECPAYDKFVVGWVQDSVYQSCYKY